MNVPVAAAAIAIIETDAVVLVGASVVGVMVAVTPVGIPSAVNATDPVNDELLVKVRLVDPAAPPVVRVSVVGEAARAIVGDVGVAVTVTSAVATFVASNVDRTVIVTGPAATPTTSAVFSPVDVTVARVASDVLQTTSVEAPP